MIAEAGEQLTDAELAARYRRDPELFTLVHDRHFRDIYLYVAGRLDTQIAEDITAETFLLAFDHRDRFDPERGGLRPWLFGLATNLIARHRRKEIRHYRALARLGPEPVLEGHENRVVASVTAQGMQPYLARALARMARARARPRSRRGGRHRARDGRDRARRHSGLGQGGAAHGRGERRAHARGRRTLLARHPRVPRRRHPHP
ncbi:RNA polymerase sigma factor [Actinomadura sp. ATCC 39365]|uniref:RNA polymerase sigma factor n=1 Tax=Nonomuraea sp. NPDC005692 TaxID=3157168 RepID=UPI0033CA1544